jgi:hypothetical protein
MILLYPHPEVKTLQAFIFFQLPHTVQIRCMYRMPVNSKKAATHWCIFLKRLAILLKKTKGKFLGVKFNDSLHFGSSTGVTV